MADEKVSVRIGKIPGNISDVCLLKSASTVRDALKAANLSSGEYQIRVDAEEASEDTVLKEGQTVLLLRKIRGN